MLNVFLFYTVFGGGGEGDFHIMKLLRYYLLAHAVFINISENEQWQLPKDRKPLQCH